MRHKGSLVLQIHDKVIAVASDWFYYWRPFPKINATECLDTQRCAKTSVTGSYSSQSVLMVLMHCIILNLMHLYTSSICCPTGLISPRSKEHILRKAEQMSRHVLQPNKLTHTVSATAPLFISGIFKSQIKW